MSEAEIVEGEESERTTPADTSLAMWCHLSTFAGCIIPFGNVIAPLIIWLTKKDENPFVDEQGKESLNFQISLTIYFFVSFVLCFLIIGFVLVPVLLLAQLILVIIASIKTKDGEHYRYPCTIRLIK